VLLPIDARGGADEHGPAADTGGIEFGGHLVSSNQPYPQPGAQPNPGAQVPPHAGAPYGPGPYAGGPHASAQGQQPQGYPPQGAYPAQGGYPAPSAYPAPGGPTPPAPRKGLSRGAIIAIVVGIVAVIGVGLGIAGSMLLSNQRGGEGSPPAVVTTYLEALAASDAEAAIAQLADPPAESPLLTDEALQASNELAPLTDIVVEPVDDVSEYTRVTATYSLGGEPVTASFDVVQGEDGVGRIQDGVNELWLSRALTGIAAVNGVPVEGETVAAFPGAYEVSSTSEYHEISGTTTVTVPDATTFVGFEDVTPALNDAGVTAFRDAITTAVQGCLASKNLVAGCGVDLEETLSDGTRVFDGTVTRTLTADGQADLANLTPELVPSEPLKASSSSIYGLDITAECEKNGSRGQCTIFMGPQFGSPVVDFGQDPIAVIWE